MKKIYRGNIKKDPTSEARAECGSLGERTETGEDSVSREKEELFGVESVGEILVIRSCGAMTIKR